MRPFIWIEREWIYWRADSISHIYYSRMCIALCRFRFDFLRENHKCMIQVNIEIRVHENVSAIYSSIVLVLLVSRYCTSCACHDSLFGNIIFLIPSRINKTKKCTRRKTLFKKTEVSCPSLTTSQLIVHMLTTINTKVVHN